MPEAELLSGYQNNKARTTCQFDLEVTRPIQSDIKMSLILRTPTLKAFDVFTPIVSLD